VVLATGCELMADDLPPRIRRHSAARPSELTPAPALGPDCLNGQDLRTLLSAYEAQLVTLALERAGGSQTRAARMLGIPRRTLVYKLRRMRKRLGPRLVAGDEVPR
jgi:DNA-binding NtrC family response regulator